MEQPPENTDLPLIKIVGISASGKSTLVKALRRRGYRARPVSQEHSNVATLWQQFDTPRLLFYLDVDLETQRARRPDVEWNKQWMVEERGRLDHARAHADLVIDTSNQSAEAVLQIALTYLENKQVPHAEEPLPLLAPTGSAIQPKQPSTPVADTTEEPPSDTKMRSNRTQRRLQKRAQKRQAKHNAKE